MLAVERAVMRSYSDAQINDSSTEPLEIGADFVSPFQILIVKNMGNVKLWFPAPNRFLTTGCRVDIGKSLPHRSSKMEPLEAFSSD